MPEVVVVRERAPSSLPLVIGGLVVLGGVGAGGYWWWKSKKAPPPGAVAGKLSNVSVIAWTGGTAMRQGEIRNLALEQAEGIAQRGFGSPAVTLRADQDFRVNFTVNNTGQVAFTASVEAQAVGPAYTYSAKAMDTPVDPGQSFTRNVVFLRSNFGVAAWTPGTYGIVAILRDAATQKVLDQVSLPAELIISGPAVAAGKLSAVTVMAL